ncbi:hypothetical protein LXL04_018034 [Taraxacum kok-saghyz]
MILNILSSKGTDWDEIDFEFLAKEKGIGSSNSTFGLTPLPTFTPIQSSGILKASCKYLPYVYTLYYTYNKPLRYFSHLHYYSLFTNLPFRFSDFLLMEHRLDSSRIQNQLEYHFQPMRIHSSLWNADDWATRGGRVKTDWSKAPFTASYRNFKADACVVSSGKSSCGGSRKPAWLSEELDDKKQKRLRWAQKNYMIYNYCKDSKRFPQGFPPECKSA